MPSVKRKSHENNGGIKMDTHNKDVFENNKQKITGHVTVHPGDAAIIDDTVEQLIEAGVGTLKEVTVEESDTWGWGLLLTNDEDRVYYLLMSEYGSIELLRKDGPDGEVIQAVLYDSPDGFELPEEDLVEYSGEDPVD